MKIGLIDTDSHNWPNLCLMKLSAPRFVVGGQLHQAQIGKIV